MSDGQQTVGQPIELEREDNQEQTTTVIPGVVGRWRGRVGLGWWWCVVEWRQHNMRRISHLFAAVTHKYWCEKAVSVWGRVWESASRTQIHTVQNDIETTRTTHTPSQSPASTSAALPPPRRRQRQRQRQQSVAVSKTNARIILLAPSTLPPFNLSPCPHTTCGEPKGKSPSWRRRQKAKFYSATSA